MYDGQLELSPETTRLEMTLGESYNVDGASYVVPSPSFPRIQPRDTSSHRVPLASGNDVHCHPPHPVTSPSSPSHPTSAPSTPLPRMSQFMRAAQKVLWDTRFPHPQSEHDNYPALADGDALSLTIHSPILQEDFILERCSTDPEFTVADIYESLYNMLCVVLSHTHPLYASRTAKERAQIEEATQRRMTDPSVQIAPWKGQVRDILGNRYVIGQFIEDYTLGKWRIDFVDGFN
jgi:hypothetical protein